MDRNEAKTRIEELRRILWENSRKYYVDNAPEISDYEYDHLMYELEDLEKAWPDLITPDSPTQRVGSDLANENQAAGSYLGHASSEENVPQNAPQPKESGFAQYPHKYPMLSLGNTYSIGEVEEFAARAVKLLEHGFTYCCELKFDGTAICLTYVHGKLFRALTRGDGVIGDDVTANVRKISNIPVQLKGNGWPDEFEIRGEILMPYEAFDRLNEERILNEDPPFANPRNAASGSLKLQDPSEVAKRGLWCTLYHIPSGNVDYPTHDEALTAAASWGLPVSDKRRICHNINEIEDFISYWDTARKKLPYATDGCVIKINEMNCQRILGYTAKFPRWAVAYKFKAEQALTKLKSISYQVGRTGAVTPVANLEPVQLSGTVVKRATLNNESQMALLDIHVGDWVYVEKGGEIIPKITGVEKSRRGSDAVLPDFPTTCPDCGTPLVRAEDEAKWFCPNTDGCPTQIKGRIIHFIGRKAMNILAGEATVDQLFNAGLVRTPADLYDLRKTDMFRLEGWKERSSQKFIDSVKGSLKTTFDHVLFALGIRYVGETTAKELALAFGNIDALATATKEDLLKVADVGDVIAESIVQFFGKPEHIVEIQRLKASGLKFSMEAEAEAASNALEGKSFVVSGVFSVSRDEIKAMIEANGGKNSSSVSGKTSYLLAGEKPGPEKIRKAADLGVQVISEADFRAMLPQNGNEQPNTPEVIENELFPSQEDVDEPSLFDNLK